MNLYLYKNLLDKRYLDKTSGLTQLSNMSAQLLDNTSYTDPTFEVSYSPVWKWCNYVYSSDLERYYYINNVEAATGNRLLIHCHVDVLMSYKDKLMDKMIVVKRSTNHKNYYLEDEQLKSYAMPCKRIVKPTSMEGLGKKFTDKEHRQFILGIVGRSPITPPNNEGGNE